MLLGATEIATPAVPVRSSKLGKVSAVLMLLGLAFIAVGIYDGSASEVGAFLPALTAPRVPTNPAPRSFLEAIEMSTQFTDPYVQRMKKKNPKTGSTTNLVGYRVGYRAPASAVKSGTTIKDVTGKSFYSGTRENLGVGSSGSNNAFTLGFGLTLLGVAAAALSKVA